MQKTITPIDNTVYVEREYHSTKIEQTIDNSMKAQKEWANLNVNERVELLKNFVEDFLSKGDVIIDELSKQIGRPISQAAGELNGFKERADYMLSIAEKKLAKSKIDFKKLKKVRIEDALIKILSSANQSNKNWITNQYDQMVMCDTAQKSGGDAAVIRIHDKEKAIDWDFEMNGGFATPLADSFELNSLKKGCYTCPMFQICNGCKKTIKDLKKHNMVEEHCYNMKLLGPAILASNDMEGIQMTPYENESAQFKIL